jgi:hypothetical protein
MSTLDEKLERSRDSGGRARRTHASLTAARGYQVEAPGLVSIQTMEERTRWRHTGGGKWDNTGAEYERTEEP